MSEITVNDVVVHVVRKKIKNLYLSVKRQGGVRLSAPHRINDEMIRLFILAKLPWIQKCKDKISRFSANSTLEYISGENHYYQGCHYILNIVPSVGINQAVKRDSKTIDLYVSRSNKVTTRKKILTNWYRDELKQQIILLTGKWEKMIGVHATEYSVKQMKTKWGSCNTKTGRIWLNLELIKKPPHCLEYVVVHELIHLLERRHNACFYSYMDRYLPNWRICRKQLNEFGLMRDI